MSWNVLLGLKRKDKRVYRFKGFDSAACGDSMSALEAMVNAWMEVDRPRIRQMCQSMRGEHILLSFVYEDLRELEQRMAVQTQTGITGSFPRFFDEELNEERPTSPRVPATPPPVH
jgi:hypothetical protein